MNIFFRKIIKISSYIAIKEVIVLKSKALAKCLVGQQIQITHIYGCEKLKNLLKQFSIDISEKVKILDINDKVILKNSKEQTLSLSFNEAYDIFGIDILENDLTIKKYKKEIIISITILILVIFIFSIQFLKSLLTIDFSLTTNSIDLIYGNNFNPNDYISEVVNAKVILPTLEYDRPGSYPLTYIAKNNFKQIEQTLMVNIIDNQNPSIKLSYDEITYDDNLQSCHFYIDEVIDNVDKDLKDKVICSNDLHFNDDIAYYNYQVSDSSGNITNASLKIIKEDNPIPIQTINNDKPISFEQAQIILPEEISPTYSEEIYEEYYEEEITYDEGVLVSYE